MSTTTFSSKRNLAILLLAIAGVVADTTTPSSDGCVDPSGFEACYQKVDNDATECANSAPNRCPADSLEECLLACGNVQDAAHIGCWVQSCWNRAYSCDYQITAITYLSDADRVQGTIDLPFYPPPENAPGGCVCNLGDVWGNITVLPLQTDPCMNFVGDGNDVVADCGCCYISSILSGPYSSCPANDISSLLSNDSLAQLVSSASGASTGASPLNDCAVLENSPSECSNTFSLAISATTWVNPVSLPTGWPGTAPLSDTSGQLTSLDFDVYTLMLFPAYTTVITPAPFNAKNAESTGGGQDIVTGSIKTSGSLVSGSSATGTVPITALVPSATATDASSSTGKSGGSSKAATTTGSASPSSSKAGAASRIEGMGLTLTSIVVLFGLLAL